MMIDGFCAAIVAFALLSADAPSAAPSPPHPRPVVVGHSTLEVQCGPLGTSLPADWYFPRLGPRKATGLVWLQHAFFRTKANIASLAHHIAAHTRAIVVAPTISSDPFAPGGCWINGAPMHGAVAKLFVERFALRQSAAAAKGKHVSLPRPFVLSGHSAGGNLATAAAGYAMRALRRDRGDLRAVVLYDAVDNQGAMSEALERLNRRRRPAPVLQIASPPSACNAFGSGTRALVAARPGRFVGVQLVDGTHVDAEGPDSDPLARAVCGDPLEVNVNAVRSIASGWVTDALTGSSIGLVGGSPGEGVPVDGATAVVLPAP